MNQFLIDGLTDRFINPKSIQPIMAKIYDVPAELVLKLAETLKSEDIPAPEWASVCKNWCACKQTFKFSCSLRIVWFIFWKAHFSSSVDFETFVFCYKFLQYFCGHAIKFFHSFIRDCSAFFFLRDNQVFQVLELRCVLLHHLLSCGVPFRIHAVFLLRTLSTAH